MAVTFDQNLGATDASGVGSVNLTTSAAAAANALIVVAVSWFSTSGASVVTGVTVAGTACAKDKHQVNGSDFADLWSCFRSSSTASGSTITVTLTSNSTGGILVGAMSFTNTLTSAYLVSTAGSNGSGTSWNSGSATNTGQADAVFVGMSGNEDATNPTTSTPSSGTEVHDRYRSADQQGIVTGYKIVSTVASDSITGSFSNANSTANTGALAIYAGTGGGGGTVVKLLSALGVG